jgi:hypothetical protein
MEKRKTKSIFSLVLISLLIVACNAPINDLPAQQTTQTGPTQPVATGVATEPPVASEGGMPVRGEGLCSNAYYPVRQGSTWTYKSTGGPAGEYSFTDTLTSVREDGFTLSTDMGGVTRTQEWSCTPEGLVALQFGGAPAATLNAQNMQLDLQVSNVSGVTFLDAINAGDQWQHNLDLQGSMTVAGQQGTATGNVQTNFTAIGEENVTVTAGTFTAMKIQVDTNLNMNVSYQGLSIPAGFSGAYTYWFVQGVGWVKASGSGTIAGTSFSEAIELQSYSIP